MISGKEKQNSMKISLTSYLLVPIMNCKGCALQIFDSQILQIFFLCWLGRKLQLVEQAIDRQTTIGPLLTQTPATTRINSLLKIQPDGSGFSITSYRRICPRKAFLEFYCQNVHCKRYGYKNLVLSFVLTNTYVRLWAFNSTCRTEEEHINLLDPSIFNISRRAFCPVHVH